MQDIRPLEGWILNRIAGELDLQVPGFAGSFLRASGERRQVIAALLSVTQHSTDPQATKDLAEFIVRADHRTILLHAFGSVPTGFRGALARCGSQPHASGFYRMLHSALGNDDVVALVIRRLKKIDPNRLRIAKLLPERVLTPALVSIVASPAMARDVGTMVALLEDKGIDRKAFEKALASLTSVEQFPSFWERWACKVTFPAPPVPRSEKYIPITSGDGLSSLARRYSNCSRSYLLKALRGDVAFAEYTHAVQSVVIQLVRKQDNWILEGVFAPFNRTALPQVRDAAVRHLRGNGIVDKFGRRTGADWSALRRLTAMSIFETDFT